MASYLGNQFINHIGLGEWWLLKGIVMTDSSGNPTNINDGSVLDQDGDPLKIPAGVTSITKVANATGTYELTLEQPWWKLKAASAMPILPTGGQATVIGTVDLTGVTLSTLNTKTLVLTDSATGAVTTTFTTPSSIANIAAQINTAMAGKNTFADIVTSAAGGQYLRIRDTTGRAASVETVAAGGNSSLAILGLTAATTNGVGLGDMVLQNWNPRGSGVALAGASPAAPLIDPQSVTFVYALNGVSTQLSSAGFSYELLLVNTSV
jgi:hypothetical protein